MLGTCWATQASWAPDSSVNAPGELVAVVRVRVDEAGHADLDSLSRCFIG